MIGGYLPIAESLLSRASDREDWTNINIRRQIRRLFGSRILRTIYTLVQNLKRHIWLPALVVQFALTAAATQPSLDEFSEAQNDSSKKGVSYVRVSSFDQVDEDDDDSDYEGSIDDQKEQNEAIAEENDIELPFGHIVDKAQTGTDFDRDGIQKVFRLCQRDEIEYLLTQSVDRIGRSAAETLYFIHLLQSECNVTLITTSGKRDMSEIQGLMHTTLLSLMAEVQNEIRTTKAKETRVKRFLKMKKWRCYSPVIPLGYTETDDGWITCDPDQNKMDDWNPEEIDAVRDVFEEFIEEKYYSRVKEKINDKYDNILEGHRVKTILQNPVYIGKPRLPEDWVEGLPYENDLDEPELQIIDKDTYKSAQEIIERKDQRHSTDEDTKDIIDFVEEFDLFTIIESSPPAKLIHDCGEPMVKNGQRDLKGDIKTHQYYCRECDETRKWPKESEYDQMELLYSVIEKGNKILNLVN